MAEDPIKLFSTRAERYPQSDAGDSIRAGLEKTINQVPVFGPVTTLMMSRFWVPSATRRLEEWLKEFSDDFDRHCAECNVENLVKDEIFISASIQVARIAVGAHQQEKRRYLRNALLNVALGKGPDEVRQQIFLNAIEAFLPAHVKTLDVIWRGAGRVQWDQYSVPIPQRNYGAAIEIFAPELKGQTSLTEAVLADLRNRGFSTLGRADFPFPQGGLITNLGVEFLNFVLSPDDLPNR